MNQQRESELRAAANKAARKFSFGAPQEMVSRATKQENKQVREDENTIRIESKPVVLPNKRQSAMRPGSIPAQTQQRQPQFASRRRQDSKVEKNDYSPNSDGAGAQKIFEVTHGDEDYQDNYDIPQKNFSAYSLFSQEFRPVLKQRYPNLTTHQIK